MAASSLSRSDRAQVALVRALVALPPRAKRALAGPPREVDGQVLDLDAQLLLRLMALEPQPPKHSIAVEQGRARTRRSAAMLSGPVLAMEDVRDLEIAGGAGTIGARLYTPTGDRGPRPLLVYLHGGGWVSGDLDTHDAPCRFLAAHAGVIVLSVDYRRPPEHRFPAAVDDALAALRWASEHAAELGADPVRIAIGGDSAGGNLAAAASRLARDGGGPLPALQLLIYPVTDLTEKGPSFGLFREGFYLTEEDIDWYRDHYLPDDGAARDPRASPLVADDLAGLPPAYVVTAGFDPLRDEGEAYADALRAAGVPTALRRHPSLFHGFANLTAFAPAARAAMLEAAGALRMGLAAGRS